VRVLFTQDTDWLLRNPAQQHHLAELMQLRGHEVLAIDFALLWRSSARPGGWSRRQELQAPPKAHGDRPVSVVRPGFLRFPVFDYTTYALSLEHELRRQCAHFGPDVIVSFGIISALASARAARRCGIPFVYYWIDVLDRLLPQAWLRSMCLAAERAALRRAQATLTINDALSDYVVRLGAQPGATHVVPAGIDERLFDPSAYSRVEARRRLSLAEDDAVLFFMGWLYPFSGVLEVARDVLASRDDNYTLVVAGEGDQYGALKNLTSGHVRSDAVRLLGQVRHSELPALIAAADVCLLPAYRHEPIMQDIVPIKLYEYMAMGKPVIATRLPGVEREFGEGHGVVYVDGPEEVLPTMSRLRDENSIHALGQRARQRVEANTWDRVADRLEQVLDTLVKEEHA